MLTKDGAKVLEYNCRLGDPETQSILLRADFDFAQACLEAARGKLDVSRARWHDGASACVVIASEGYPANPLLGKAIGGIDEAGTVPGAVVFHSGTKLVDGEYLTTGGRVLGIAARGGNLEQATSRAYEAAAKIRIEGAHYRKDIGRGADERRDLGQSLAAEKANG